MKTTKRIECADYIHGEAKISDNALVIDLYNSLEKVGFIEVDIEKFRQMNINRIYCLDRYRRNGIGTCLMDLTEYMLKDYNNYTLYGVYCPYQSPDEVYTRTRQELNDAASKFYAKKGFDIVSLHDFEKDPKKYPNITSKNFDLTVNSFGNSIVEKFVKTYEDDNFCEVNGIIRPKVFKKS